MVRAATGLYMWVFNDLFPTAPMSVHLTHKMWLKQGLRMPETLCAAVPQSSIQWNVRTAGVRA